VTATTNSTLPRIELRGFHDANVNGRCDVGEEVAMPLVLPPQNQTDVELTLVPDNCIALLRL